MYVSSYMHRAYVAILGLNNEHGGNAEQTVAVSNNLIIKFIDNMQGI